MNCIKPPNLPDSPHKLPIPIARPLRAVMAVLALLLMASSALAATITYNFNDGTLMGWHNRAWSTNLNAWTDLDPGVTALPFSVNAGVIQPPSADNYLYRNSGTQIDPNGGQNDNHQNTVWLRSPAFALDGSGDLTAFLFRGMANGPAPANETAVSYQAADGGAGTGWKGVALRRVSDGQFVLAKPRLTTGDTPVAVTFTAAELAPYVGVICTVDLINSERGGWGWLSMDNVTIPGVLKALTATVAPSVALGGSTTLTVTIPAGHNASTAVTAYVTNGNPSKITLNGSSAAYIAVTFAAGGANTQNITVAGTALGYAPLTITGGGLELIRSGITVLPVSGLIGRWFNGTEDLLDKSGYMPAGTHNGMMSGGNIPAFSVDVPPGVTGGSSLDLSGGSAAVLITNTSVLEAGYQPTFDGAIARQFSVVFWAKGLPGGWNPFLSKYGEGSTGWQVRRVTDSSVATFTIRGTRAEDDPYNAFTAIDDFQWHHFAATWDGVTGIRRFYVDGKLNSYEGHDFGPMGVADGSMVALGSRLNPGASDPGTGPFFAGQLYDVQIYGLPLSGAAVQGLYTMNTANVIAHADKPIIDLTKSVPVSVSIPAGANASSAVTVQVQNTTPSTISVSGAVGNVTTLMFAAGAPNSQTITVTGLAEGAGNLSCSASGLTTGTLALQVYGKHLIGRWFKGDESLADSSGFRTAGTHDGMEYGGAIAYTNDVPPGKTGKGAFFGGSVGVVINNSCALDGGTYLPTYDDVVANQFTLSFWARGVPGTWAPFISKRGEERSGGWQVRRSGVTTEAFTLRGSQNPNFDGVGSVSVTDGQWHHYAAVWDGHTGTRKCYVDGTLDPSINLTADAAPMLLAPNHRLMLGARSQEKPATAPAVESQYNGTLYDVAMYNYPLTETEVKALAFVPALRVIPVQRSLEAPNSMTVDVVIPEGANQSTAVTVQVTDNTPLIASLTGAVGNVLTLNFGIGTTRTQQVTVVGIKDGKGQLTASGGGFVAGVGTFNVWIDPGSKLIGHWLSGPADLVETSGFRPAGTHNGVAVGNPANIMFSAELPPAYAATGGNSLDLNNGGVAVAITNTSTVDSSYVETFDNQVAKKITIAFWAKGTPMDGDWNPWIAKRGENDMGYQVRRVGGSNPAHPTFTIRGTPGNDDPDTGKPVNDNEWHHYAATWDGATGVRKLYLDGKTILNMSGDTGPMALATADHLVFGGRDSGGFGNYFTGLLYDVRVYSYALSELEVGVLAEPPTALTLTLDPTVIPQNQTLRMIVRLPISATASGPLTVYLTNNSPSVVTIVGSTGNVLPLVFPQGTSALSVNLLAIGPGQINITAGATGQTEAQLNTVNTVVAAKLVGHWFNGAADLVDKSGATLAGTHDGIAVGVNPIAYSSDVPPGFTGQSLDLTANTNGATTTAVLVNNSGDLDGSYQPTFNDGISWTFSVSLWAKGVPGGWNGFVAKRGEDGIGWQMRRSGGVEEAFTIRGTASGNQDGIGSVNITGTPVWRHFVGVWDGITGTRKCYVNGVLDPNVNITGDFGPMALAPNHHLLIGARESAGVGGYEAWFPGLLYDVRVYNYPITAEQVAVLAGLAAPRPQVTILPWTGNQVRISWPTSWAGYALEQSSSLTTGWGPSGLTVNVVGNENVALAPSVGTQFYRLKK